MMKWRGIWRVRKLRSRFLLAMILLSLPPLCVLGTISYNIAKEALKDNNRQANLDHLETSSEVADLLLRNIINLNRFIVMNPDIREDLRNSEINDTYEQANKNVRTISRLQKVINDTSLDMRFIDSICVMDVHFQNYCRGRSDDAGIYEGPWKATSIERAAWYRQAAKSQGKVEFFNYNVLDDNDNSFSTVKLFRDADSYRGDPIGLVIINLSKTMFNSVFKSSQESGTFLAIDSSGEKVDVVFPNDIADKGELEAGNLRQALEALHGQGYLTSEFRNQTTGWTFLHIIQSKQLLGESNRIGMATTLIASLIALVALVLSFLISGSITRPLLRLKRTMTSWAKGNREIKESFKDDEIGAIGNTFIHMARENQELDARLYHSELKEREAELRTLQAQIKPHFLYNTLDSIYWMVRLKKTDEAAAMTLALSESFKLSLNKGKEVIPIFKELQHVEHYMTIQNIRYKGRFTYETAIDPDIQGFEILKLILQPLVENAIYHGLEPKVGPGTIRLEGRKEGDYLVFVLEDDGVGMDDIAMTEQGYGIRNVRDRLQLYYGDSSSFAITSQVNQGTRIEIRILPFPQEANARA
ncbi:sensor histidine kinase [Cohnella sp. GCM10027633]|uniref:sensor histidine kinase n=1 Tax=unclassified Cohnella TaxID=2636738 RepID=UPI0036376AF2